MKIYGYENDYNKSCTIEIPSHLEQSYIEAFGASSPSKKQVEKWALTKNYEVKQRGAEGEYVCIAIGD